MPPLPGKPEIMTFLACVFSFIPFAVIVARPENSDWYAAGGACFAVIMALIEARKKDRSAGHLISTIVGCAVFGLMGPGAAHNIALRFGWITSGDALFLSWHIWGLAGFFLGFNGWAIFHGGNVLIQRRAAKVLGLPDPGVTFDSASTKTQSIPDPTATTRPRM